MEKDMADMSDRKNRNEKEKSARMTAQQIVHRMKQTLDKFGVLIFPSSFPIYIEPFVYGCVWMFVCCVYLTEMNQ